MAVNPTANVGQNNLPAIPCDKNNYRAAVLIGAVVDDTTKEVTGFLPLKVVNNGDGTATLVVTVE